MRTLRTFAAAAALALMALAGSALPAGGQVGKNNGVLDPNLASEAELAALPGLNATLAKAIVANRPFLSMSELNGFLEKQALTAEQRTALWPKLFLPINLLSASDEEILMVPGAGRRMLREFKEYRPYKGGLAVWRKEIGKYVDAAELARLEQYVFVPIDLNTATDADILSVPGAGRRMVHEFKEYRPWKTKAQFEKEIGKYVGPKETARLWTYVVINPAP
jgi:DNA uptake protein ComE-like DNA-binding protein